MSKLRIGFVLTGSFCTFAKVMPVIQALIERGDTVTPILSDSAGTLDTRFGTAAHWREELTALTGIPLSTALFPPSRLDRRRCLIY